jgi:hypothetical protein
MRNEMNSPAIFQTSIDEYTEILAMMKAISEPGIHNRGEEFENICSKLLKKQQIASQHDKQILQLLKDTPELLREAKTGERTNLIKSVVGLNKQILPKLESIKTLISCELKQMKNSRSAIKGYQQNENTYGRNLNNTL